MTTPEIKKKRVAMHSGHISKKVTLYINAVSSQSENERDLILFSQQI